MKSHINFPALMLALFVAESIETKACSCLEPPPVSQALQQSSAVFLGKVKEFKPVTILYSLQDKLHPMTFRQATFEVVRSWKGITNQTAIVYTSENGAMCGYRFIEGKSYLIYAQQETWTLSSSTTNVLFTSICSRTKESAKAQNDLESLDAKPAESKK